MKTDTDADVSQERQKKKIGRPEGSLNKLTREARQRAMDTGLLPHEILLSIARGEIQTEQYWDAASGEVLTRKIAVEMTMRVDAAKAAAPYYAPKMSTVEILKTGSDDELDRLIAELAAEAGFTSGTTGEGETGSAEEGAAYSAGEPSTGGRRRAFRG